MKLIQYLSFRPFLIFMNFASLYLKYFGFFVCFKVRYDIHLCVHFVHCLFLNPITLIELLTLLEHFIKYYILVENFEYDK